MKKRTKKQEPLRELPPGIEVGRNCMFLYPLHPFHGIHNPGVKPHFIQVSRVRDLVQDPLDPEEVEAEPLLMRSRWQVFGIEVETGATVSFHDEYMQAIHPVDNIPDPSIKP